ncbi:hypothetical protein CR513_06951, partial [Mucuna pruriens]
MSGGPDEAVSNKQYGVPTKHELHQYEIVAEHERHHPRPQDASRTSVGSSNLPSQTIPNLRGNASIVTLRSGRELPQITLQQELRPTDIEYESDADSQAPQ